MSVAESRVGNAQQPESKGAYRTPPEPCLACEEREAAAEAMRAFEEPGDRRCSECRSSSISIYTVVCTGGGQRFILKKGWWFTTWGKKLFKCDLENAPRHFHFRCQTCKHRWTMLTASESRTE